MNSDKDDKIPDNKLDSIISTIRQKTGAKLAMILRPSNNGDPKWVASSSVFYEFSEFSGKKKTITKEFLDNFAEEILRLLKKNPRQIIFSNINGIKDILVIPMSDKLLVVSDNKTKLPQTKRIKYKRMLNKVLTRQP